MLNRRGFINGLLATPVIIKTSGILMPISKPRFIQCRIVSRHTWNLVSGSEYFNISENGIVIAKNVTSNAKSNSRTFIASVTDNETGKVSTIESFYHFS